MPFLFFFFSIFWVESARGDVGLATFFFFADAGPLGRGFRALSSCFFLGVARVGVRKGVGASLGSSGSSRPSSSESSLPGAGAKLDCGSNVSEI